MPCYVPYILVQVKDSSTVWNETDSITDPFKEPLSITNAYLELTRQLEIMFKDHDLVTLRSVLMRQARTPDGVKLSETLKDKMFVAKSSHELVCIVYEDPSCHWLDTRLLTALAHGCGLNSAVELINNFKHFVFQKKFYEALPTSLKPEEANKYVTVISAKVKIDANKITIGDFMEYKKTMDSDILELVDQRPNLQHFSEGCLEFSYFIPVGLDFNAYKMALHNCYKFYTIDVMLIKIGNHPLIYDPWLSDLDKHSVKSVLHTHHEGMLPTIINL